MTRIMVTITLARRSRESEMIYDWGINDADYVIRQCQIYRCWSNMIMRCYSSKFQAKQRTYIGCWVDERWRSFMAFRVWYLEQAPKSGEQLDKDFLGGEGELLYSPETCCFIPGWLNSLFCDSGASRGKYPQGVYKQGPTFVAQISCRDVNINLGRFDTPAKASAVYLKAKAAYMEELILENPHWPPRLVAAIRRKMTELIQQEKAL